MLYFYIIICIVFWGLSQFFNKLAVDRLSPYVSQLVTEITCLLLIPFLIWKIKSQNLQFTKQGITFTILATIAGVVAGVSFSWAIKINNLGQVSTLTSIYPIIPVLLSIVFLKEEFTFTKFLGLIMILSGVILLQAK